MACIELEGKSHLMTHHALFYFTLCQVKSTVGSDFAGANRYNIELYDTTGTSTINMSHELVFLGRAFGSQDCIQVC